MTHVLVPSIQQHFLDLDSRSYALLSDDPTTERVAIFVHGFGGHPHKTWRDFQRLIGAAPAWARTDCYFIGYSSVADEPQLSATYFQNFLARLLPSPPWEMLLAEERGVRAAIRSAPTAYEGVVLYGHSLGGVVIRMALLEMAKREMSQATPPSPGPAGDALRGALRLYAPAQGGARPAGLIGVASSVPVVRGMVGLFRGRSPSFQELIGSTQTLQALREDTTYFAEARPDLSALRASIAWAHHDDVVSSFGYRHDASFTIAHTTHKTVCKPSRADDAAHVFAVTGSLQGHPGAL